jgi:hypothetical protein
VRFDENIQRPMMPSPPTRPVKARRRASKLINCVVLAERRNCRRVPYVNSDTSGR